MTARRALALLAALSLLLVGCSDDPEPKMPDPPETSSATPTEEPTETETPEAESAEDFIRRWVEASNAMLNSGETSEYLRLSSRCSACKQVAGNVEAAFEAGGFYRTDGWKVLDITDQTGAGKRPVLDVRVDSAPTVMRASSSADEERYPGGVLIYRFRLRTGDPWVVTQLTQIPS